MKRHDVRERADAAARDQAEQRTEALLAKLKARESDARPPTDEDPPAPLPEEVPTAEVSEPSNRRA